ncbi:permease prefix domain 1-containing protein [Vallitalea okinawensis]|uniref:permease prefix domain 1-containing protein n=1 Tax=Vallitalea okinawensis TaxID=2078660 RepID=UPI000CFD874F|nr:permease prefix domain 1-containing protein [Vallitalea okinawensis]
METIINYLENMFATLPKTKQMNSLKEDLLANMEDKYNELKRNGKTENEAIGIVISEFGNIDELVKEFGIKLEEKKEQLPMLTDDQVNKYLEANKKMSKVIGIGVFLCIIGAAVLILMIQLSEDGLLTGLTGDAGAIIGLVPLLVLVALGVGLMIYSGTTMERFKYIEDDFELPTYLKKSIENKMEAFHPTYTLSTILGVVLCILSPIALFMAVAFNNYSILLGVVILLLIVSIAVYIFIYFGSIYTGYKKLLKIDEYARVNKENNKVINAVAAVIWPLAVAIFLISGMVYHQWHINWIVFPITGLLFAMFSGAYNALNEKD